MRHTDHCGEIMIWDLCLQIPCRWVILAQGLIRNTNIKTTHVDAKMK